MVNWVTSKCTPSEVSSCADIPDRTALADVILIEKIRIANWKT
jgi:hypothetical protein